MVSQQAARLIEWSWSAIWHWFGSGTSMGISKTCTHTTLSAHCPLCWCMYRCYCVTGWSVCCSVVEYFSCLISCSPSLLDSISFSHVLLHTTSLYNPYCLYALLVFRIVSTLFHILCSSTSLCNQTNVVLLCRCKARLWSSTSSLLWPSSQPKRPAISSSWKTRLDLSRWSACQGMFLRQKVLFINASFFSAPVISFCRLHFTSVLLIRALFFSSFLVFCLCFCRVELIRAMNNITSSLRLMGRFEA